MKIVFLGTSEVGLPILDALRQEHEIRAVVTAPDKPVGRKQVMTASPIAEYAAQHTLLTFKPEKVKTNLEFHEQLRQLGADVFIVVSYGKILPQALLDIPPLKTLNVHFSLLPKYRGAAPIQFALLNGETKTGTTIFVLDELLDHGPIIGQEAITVDPYDTFTTLSQKLAALSAQLLIRILPGYADGSIKPVAQDHDAATNTRLINKEDGKIDWNKSAQEIYNQYRAFEAWPGIWTTWQGKQLKIVQCKPNHATHSQQPGSVLPDGLIACGTQTTLQLIELQLEGKTKTTVESFLRGHPVFMSSTLGN